MNRKIADVLTSCSTAAFALLLMPHTARSESYVQTNLVSSVSGLAAVTDPSLINPWGVSFSATSPFWVSDQGANLSTLYSGAGVKNTSTIVTVPNPTGQVFTSASGFVEPGGGNLTSTFTFATLGGGIYAWNPANGNTAQLAASTAGAVYTGLALASNETSSFLYAANVASGKIDVFNSSFGHATLSGSFIDPTLPSGYVPYNIQNVNGQLYVEYEKGTPAVGAGVVSVFDANGNFQKELIGAGGKLDNPWGIVIAPAGFGAFANDLLVGNFGNGQINAFDPATGAFIGTLDDASGNPVVNSGLWSLSTRTGAGFDPNAVYFTAGIDSETQGLFGSLSVATPEPISFGISGFGLLALGLAIWWRGHKRPLQN